MDEKKKAGFIIISISSLLLIITLVSGGIWFNSIDLSFSNNDVISGSSFNASVDNDLNHNEIFQDVYYSALDILSNRIYYGTTWLDVCPNSQKEIDGQVYVKVCSSEYDTIQSIKKSATNYISSDLVDELMGNNYLEKDGELYILPVSFGKNKEYAGFDSYYVKSSSPKKIEFVVKSKYMPLDCKSNCESFETHSLVLEKIGDNWVVSSIEMPY